MGMYVKICKKVQACSSGSSFEVGLRVLFFWSSGLRLGFQAGKSTQLSRIVV